MFEGMGIRCVLCGEIVPIRMSAKSLPYIVCDDCGYQWFIRHERGVKRLKRISLPIREVADVEV